MATKTSHCLWLALLFISLHTQISWSLLDFDELSSINYGIDIMNVPVVIGQEATPGSVRLKTKYGQQYQCGYRDKSVEEKKNKEEEKVAEEIGIPELLRPMKDGPCLILAKDWWTYEFCYGKSIKQYHTEDGKILGNTVYLGFYQSEFDWNNENVKANANKKRSQLIRYHSQQYVNGTLCDLTGNPRSVEVRFQCESGAGDYIARIDEPETCVYVLTIYTMKICHHPYLKPLSPHKPVPIMCNPVLSAEDYQEYLEEQEAVERKAKEEAERLKHIEKVNSIRAFKEQQEREKLAEADSGSQTSDGGGQMDENSDASDNTHNLNSNEYQAGNELDTSVQTLEKLMINSLSKGLQDLVKENQEGNNPNVNIDLKVVKDPKEMRKYMNEFLAGKEKDEDTQTELQDSVTSSKDSEAKEADTHRDKNDAQIDTQIKDSKIKMVDPVIDDHTEQTDTEATLQENKRSNSMVTKQDIDVDDKLDEDTDREALEEFDKGLENIDKKRISKLNQLKDTIESAVQSKFSDIIKEAQEELQQEGLNDEIDKPDAYKRLAKTLNKLLKRLDDTGKDLKKMDERLIDKLNQVKAASGLQKNSDEGATSPDSAKVKDSVQNVAEASPDTDTIKSSSKSTTDHAKIRVRVTRVKHKDGELTNDDKLTSKNSLKIPQEQKEKLENSVRSELERAGMDTQGRKIEVKIITAGYYEKDDDSMHVLSDQDTTAFNKMVLTILGRSQETEREIERQERMESNYKLVWRSNKKKESSSLPGDTEEN